VNGNQSLSGNHGALGAKSHRKIDVILIKLRNIDSMLVFILLVVPILVVFYGLLLVVMEQSDSVLPSSSSKGKVDLWIISVLALLLLLMAVSMAWEISESSPLLLMAVIETR